MYFLTLSCIARDILAIAGVSIAVKWLFSRSKHTMSDAWSSMHHHCHYGEEGIPQRQFSNGLDYLEGISIH
ncbi:hypothetical protein DFH07DRAFT_736629 [Mycena maculata]|uniref:Uncharacterized protein n=1 Tax=Mycena maculata TaxID=230809 RepID=A0AAD7JMC2_9AGAR|nr:hypothetical protein DFH07DRAFT_736629 [Mycena maculata]